MSLWLWSWLLAALNITSLWWSGHSRNGWLMLAAIEPLWVVYALITGQSGFIASAAAFAAVGIRNYLRQRRQP